MLRVLACLSLLLISLPLSAQDSGKVSNEVKIGYVNIRKIMAQAPQIAQIQEKLSKEFEAQRKAIIALRNEVASLSNAYDQALANKTDEEQPELQSLRKAIDDKQLALSKSQQRTQDAYNLRRNEALANLQRLVVNTVAEVSKEKHLDIVLNNTGVIYVNTRIDITPAVFQSLAEKSID